MIEINKISIIIATRTSIKCAIPVTIIINVSFILTISSGVATDSSIIIAIGVASTVKENIAIEISIDICVIIISD